MAKAPKDAHEWVSFDSTDEERTWRFDLTYLESNWMCIFGAGCQGVLTEDATDLVQGCCSYGAHLLDADDVANTLAKAALLTDAEWQLRSAAPDDLIVTNAEGETTTALVDDACVFLNRPGFAAGPGCAFHVAAANHGESFVHWKPEVCWQLPLRREDEVTGDGYIITSVGQWERRHWGAGGAEFHWWCSEAPEAYVGTKRVVDSMRDELIATVGKKTYARLIAFMDERSVRLESSTPLPHPVARRAPKGS